MALLCIFSCPSKAIVSIDLCYASSLKFSLPSLFLASVQPLCFLLPCSSTASVSAVEQEVPKAFTFFPFNQQRPNLICFHNYVASGDKEGRVCRNPHFF